MKSTFVFSSLLLILILSSCSKNFYQIYKVEPDNKIVKGDLSLTYEDDNCIISYNLWDDKGNLSFVFHNKTDRNIFLNMDDCFYVLNGLAHPYFQNRTYTTSKSYSLSNLKTVSSIPQDNSLKLLQTYRFLGASTNSGYSVSYTEQNTLCIPSKASRIIAEYIINDEIFRDCKLFRFPTKKLINTISYSEGDSPFKFENRLTYMKSETGEIRSIENKFFVSEITNYPESEITHFDKEVYCGQEGLSKTIHFNTTSPDMFYIKYAKGSTDHWLH